MLEKPQLVQSKFIFPYSRSPSVRPSIWTHPCALNLKLHSRSDDAVLARRRYGRRGLRAVLNPNVALRRDGSFAGRFGPRSLTSRERIAVFGFTAAFLLLLRYIQIWPRTVLRRCALALLCLGPWLCARRVRAHAKLHRPHEVLPLKESCLAKLRDITVHYLRRANSQARRVACCFHGAGASSLSWEPSLECLEKQLDAEVIAFDAPGFGLTERPPLPLKKQSLDVSPYSCSSSGQLGLALARIYDRSFLDSRAESCDMVFLGHSLGTISASLAVLSLPPELQGRTLLVLEGAAFSPDSGSSSPGQALPAPPRLSPPTLKLLKVMLPWILRRVVYNPGFWKKGLQQASAGKKVEEELVKHYRWPSLVEGWDLGLTNWVLTRVHGSLEEQGLCSLLADARKTSGLRILLVHGEDDPVIPVSNAVNLAKALDAPLVRLSGGHTPHELIPQEFSKVVGEFLSGKTSESKLS
eukprot:TRINITY_DN79688_c0_g1_i1.p1 TRINITY_DN79688_c0_g1~~TRINITY_DN79688_c0_g1_i1.p1  ORF type:complete len:468 (+),score=70.40 TRINITY_DN79688_c0_g1_i1:86-1489(+)